MRVTRDEVDLWLGRRPGVFEAPTERECWEKMWFSFSGLTTKESSYLDFSMAIHALGFNTRPTCCGGYILDTI